MDKDYIKNIIQKILNKEFSNHQKRKMVDYQDRFNFACPYCGDSHKRNNAKRGNLYLNRLFYVCFNCDKKTTLDKFTRDYNEQIDPDKKLEMIEYLDSVMTYTDYSSEFVDAKFDDLIDFEDLERVFKENITPITDFKPIDSKGGIYKYLINRGIPPSAHNNIYQGKFWKTEDQSEWIIIMLNRRGDKILGMQIRNLKKGKRRMFKIYNYESLLEWVNFGKENVEEPDINKMIIYNKLSYYFNILNINFGEEITVFEGYLDSLFFPNSLGMVGINTDSKFIESNDLDLRYFFDNDSAGFKKSVEKIKEGYKVFLWKKLFEDIVEKKNPYDPYKLLHRISKVKDLNKLSELVPDSYIKLGLERYFSNDIMDIKWIPKPNVKWVDYANDYNRKFENIKYL